MAGRFDHKQPFPPEQDDSETSPENSIDSPSSGTCHDSKITSISFPKRRRSTQKRVVSVTIKDVEGSSNKATEISIPPSDSWAWRKYGQKPIKGSPHPRGYYRCSSSKGCPARKQVEKSRVDPNVLLVTYFCEHNHSRPAARNNHNYGTTSTTMTGKAPEVVISDESDRQKVMISDEPEQQKVTSDFSSPSEADSEERITTTCHESSLAADNELGWFLNFEPTPSFAMLESPILTETKVSDTDMSMIFSKRVEDESLFADLGELPEFSREFRRGVVDVDEECRRRIVTPWCGTT